MSIFSFLFGCSQQPKSVTVLDKSEFKSAMSSNNVQLVDVRTAVEYKSGHINNAINIDVFNHSKFIEAFNKLDKNKAVFVYCRSGKRSNKAAKKLDSLGFKTIYDLKGGYLNWIKN
ncbi:rhodanese [Tamlana nanhaiensis]|uniref:Rhodanese n=2 Tax=Neotamlana nanhaiensis TaxID=1382798 RepID=A0A0D7WAP7_9FLAO|nr:rhodanese [Tamlana nanhaiensis]